jgi:hypothetical protein
MRKPKNNPNFDFNMDGVFSSISYPCWYACLENKDNISKIRWKLGVTFDIYGKEYSFDISKLGDLSDKKFLKKVTSAEFAIKILDLYKKDSKKFELMISNGEIK